MNSTTANDNYDEGMLTELARIVCNERCVSFKKCVNLNLPNPFPTCSFVPVLRGIIALFADKSIGQAEGRRDRGSRIIRGVSRWHTAL